MAHTSSKPPPQLLTLRQFAERHPAFPVSTLRWLRHRSTGPEPNGYDRAFVKVAGRVLVNVDQFFGIIEQQNGRHR